MTSIANSKMSPTEYGRPASEVKAMEVSIVKQDDDDRCGLFCLKPRWMKVFANPISFIIVYSLAGLTTVSSWSYFSAIISTLEKRFAVSSTIVTSLLVISDASTLLTSVFLAYYGGNRHRPKLIGIGIVLWGIGCAVMASPHFIFGSRHMLDHESNNNSTINSSEAHSSDEMCGSSKMTVEDSCKGESTLTINSTVSLVIMATAIFLNNVGGVLYAALGLSYIDDNMDKKQSSAYYGILMSVRWIGMLMGFLLGSYTLSQYQDPFYDHRIDNNDKRWIGAWWLGYLIISVPVILLGILTSMFPKELIRKKSEDYNLTVYFENKVKTENKKKIEIDHSWAAFPRRVMKILRNPVFMFHQISQAVTIFAYYGLFSFSPKYLEQQFNINPSEANLYNGLSSVLPMCIGLIFGGIVTKLVRPEPKRILQCATLALLLSSGCQVGRIFIKCDDLIHSTDQISNFTSEELCNSHCKCDVHQYKPICVLDTMEQHFSPCFAGCQSSFTVNNTMYYSGCSCIPLVVHNKTYLQPTIIDGKCNINCTISFNVYLLMTAVDTLIWSMTAVAMFLVSIRCVDKADKSLSQGISMVIFSAIAFLPSPLAFGGIVDSSCSVWDYVCDEKRSCWFYDLDMFRILLHAVPAGALLFSALMEFLAVSYSSKLKNFYENDNDHGY